MRIATLAALVLLTAGCAAGTDHSSHGTSGSTPPVTSQPAVSTSAQAKAAPAPGAPIAEVVAWIKAGSPAAGDFHTARQDSGASTDLGEDTAFSSPSGKITCTTYLQYYTGMSCIVALKNPPPKPADTIGNWVGGWVYYDRAEMTVGSPHGDPGPFIRGRGPELSYGNRLAFGDYSCRMDSTGLYCVDPTAKSGVRMSDAGIVPFGCFQKQANPRDTVGEAYAC
ncbi:hypothetical protein [Nocardia sp. NPDC052566]|uniref:hypothetical protein n=1 Tax=Nocardia sp. NPDC052566 TaxID=3364330 RepID=UPI0037C97AEE